MAMGFCLAALAAQHCRNVTGTDGRSVRISPDDEEHGLRPDFLLEDHQSLHTNAHGKLPHKGNSLDTCNTFRQRMKLNPIIILVLHY